MLSSWEFWVAVLLAVILFGAGSIPKLARNLGRAKGEFERGMRDGEKMAKGETAADDEAAATAADDDQKKGE